MAAIVFLGYNIKDDLFHLCSNPENADSKLEVLYLFELLKRGWKDCFCIFFLRINSLKTGSYCCASCRSVSFTSICSL